MVHAHDNHGRGDDHQPPGTGSIDWYSVTGALSEANFHGARYSAALDQLSELVKTRRILHDAERYAISGLGVFGAGS